MPLSLPSTPRRTRTDPASLEDSWTSFEITPEKQKPLISPRRSLAQEDRSHIYRPVRGPGAKRIRPALPTSFLQLAGDDGDEGTALNTPWRSGSPASTVRHEDDVFSAHLTGLRDSTSTPPVRPALPSRDSSCGSATDSSPPSTPTDSSNARQMRFSTCFGPGSSTSLLAVENAVLPHTEPAKTDKAIESLTPPRHRQTRSDSAFSSPESETASPNLLVQPSAGLKPWSTPTTDRTPRRSRSRAGIGSIRRRERKPPSSPSSPTRGTPDLDATPRQGGTDSLRRSATRKVVATFRVVQTASERPTAHHVKLPTTPAQSRRLCSSGSSANYEEGEVLHIRIGGSAVGLQRNKAELQSDARALRVAKVAERNLKIRAEEPKVKDLGTTMDGLFGIGKEESKAGRCGYAGLGIGSDKKSWKETEDFQGLLTDNVRSSVYNYTARRRRKSSAASSPRSPRSPGRTPPANKPRRKGPPPPLDLSGLSSYAPSAPAKGKSVPLARKHKKLPAAPAPPAAKLKVHERTSIEKAEKVVLAPLPAESSKAVDIRPRRMTIKGILRSVRSISNMRS